MIDQETKKESLIIAFISSILYGIIMVIIAISLKNYYVFYSLLGMPVLFWLVYCFVYTIEEGVVYFLTPSLTYELYDNKVDNFFTSEFEKRFGSVVLPIIAFIPMLIFYLLFSWIFYLVKVKRI